ncbi:tripartite motif-containing protein 35-like [Arapaima gigas]
MKSTISQKRELNDIVGAHLLKHHVPPREPSKQLCSLHQEERKLYCLQDQEAICLVCMKVKEHQNHPVCPIQERAVLTLQEELKEPLRLMKEKMKAFGHIKDVEVKMAGHIKVNRVH